MVSMQPMIPEWQTKVGEDMSDWVRKFLKMYTPGEAYGGQLSVTSPSSYEQTGLNQLEQLLAGPVTGDIYGAAKGQIMDTLAGKYSDPSQSPYIQAATKLAGQNLQDAITTARGQRGARGTYFTRSGIQEESRLSERTQNALNAIIGDFMNQERGRQLSAVPMAESLEKYGQLEAPLQRIAASQTYGSLPRILEQASLDRMYQDYTRQRSELAGVPGVGSSVLGKSVPYGIPNWTAPVQSSSSGTDWLNLALKMLPIIMAA